MYKAKGSKVASAVAIVAVLKFDVGTTYPFQDLDVVQSVLGPEGVAACVIGNEAAAYERTFTYRHAYSQARIQTNTHIHKKHTEKENVVMKSVQEN